METIRIDVKGKIARGDDQKIVCDNRSYQAEFSFSEEWEKYPIKTLCVKYSGKKYEEPFSGNVVPIPKILNTVGVEIGVYAEDMEVSTPAYFDCVKSIKSGNAVHADPPKDVYDELAQLADETRKIAQSVRDDADAGAFDGPQGPPGSNGISPEISSSPVPGGHMVSIRDHAHEEDFVVKDGENYILTDADIEKIAEKAKPDLTEYVSYTDYATDSKAGVIKYSQAYGTYVNPTSGILTVKGATAQEIRAKYSDNKPITPSTLDFSVKLGLTTNSETLTDDEKAAVQEWLGVTEIFGNIDNALDRIVALQNSLIGGDSA